MIKAVKKQFSEDPTGGVALTILYLVMPSVVTYVCFFAEKQ